MSHLSLVAHRSRGRATSPVAALLVVAALVLALLGGLLVTAPAASAGRVEDYGSYDGQRWCARRVRPGTARVQRWAVRHYGGSAGGTLRGCHVGGRSEHKEGRAFDWTLDATSTPDRWRAWRFVKRVLADDARGREHALARRMGIMYVIWNDHSWSSWNHYRRRDYLPASCPSRRRCSPTARHRDHVHVSLTRAGARARTSWFQRFR